MYVRGQEFENGVFFLPEMMAAALSTRVIMDILTPYLTVSGAEPIGKDILATVKGDLRYIGMNLIGMMLEGAGYEVITRRVDVLAEKFIETIRNSDAKRVSLSALLTTTILMIGTTIQALEDAGGRENVKAMVGGTEGTLDYVDTFGADGYAPVASAAVRQAKDNPRYAR